MPVFQLQQQWDPFRELQREVGRLFRQFESSPAAESSSWQFPAVNIYEGQDEYTLTAELPGMNPDDLDLSITGETLILRGERKRPTDITDESYRRQERRFGRWTRTLTLPERIDSEKVVAEFTNGVLTVRIPKAEEAKPRQIAVTSRAS